MPILHMGRIGIDVGTSTITACFLIAHLLVNFTDWPRLQASEDDVVTALGRVFVSIFRITANCSRRGSLRSAV